MEECECVLEEGNSWESCNGVNERLNLGICILMVCVVMFEGV